MEEMSQELRTKEEELKSKVQENEALTVQCERLKEEMNTYKGRCANL